jgi:hypothetical protein
MKSLLKSFPKLFTILLAVSFFLAVTNAGAGEEFIAPVPDKSKTMPANDGGTDGCDSSRFKCVMGGKAVLDNQTGLVWVRDAQFVGKKVSWEDAVKSVESVNLGDKKGWRLPTRDELITLLDTSESEPALPEGHPFLNIKDLATASGRPGGYHYWSSTDYKDDSNSAWIVQFYVGKVYDSHKLMDATYWPVRDDE